MASKKLFAKPEFDLRVDEEDDAPSPGNEREDANDSTLGNAKGKPRSEKRPNAIVEHLNESETTTRDSPLWPEGFKKPYNPDDLVQKYADYRIYDQHMPNDDQVSVCLELKKDLVLGSGFEFVCDGGEDEGEDDDVEGDSDEGMEDGGKKVFRRYISETGDDEEDDAPMPGMPGMKPEESPEEQMRAEMRDAKKKQMLCIKRDLEVAFNEDVEVDLEDAFTEMLLAYDIGFSLTEKVWKKRDDGSITLKSLKTRHPSSWRIHQDDKGNITKYEQHTPSGPKAIQPTALIHYVNNPRYGNPYGKSDLRPAYDAWFIKREIVKYFAIFLEGAAGAKPVAKYPNNAPPEVVAELFNAIKRFQTKTALTIPKEVEVEFLEANSAGDAYIKAINLFNMFIGRSLFIPDLLGFQGAETTGGAQALGREQMGVFLKHAMKRRRKFERLVNMHLVKPFVNFNYGFVEKYPKFRLKEISDEKATEYAKIFLEAMKGKLYEPSDEEINHFRDLIKFPKGPIERPEPAPSPMLPDGSPNPAHPAVAAGMGEDEEEGGEGPGLGGKPVAGGLVPKPAKEMPKKFASAFEAAPGDYGGKVNFKLLKSGLTQALAKTLDEGKPIIEEIYDDLFRQIRDKKILQSQDLSKIEKLKVKKLPQLRALLKRRFLALYKDMQVQARSEILKGAKNYAAPLAHEDFLNFLDEETFQYIGDFEYNVKKGTRLALSKAIKDGKPLSDVLGVLDDEGKKLSRESLERYARTKFTEVMNRARKEAFEETGVVAAYQFTAILDDRVSEVCGGLHGAIFEADDAPTPPLHFNCRSTLIPITKYEKYEVTKSVEGMNIDKFIDENIGDGFSRE